MSEIVERLLAPSRRLSLEALAANWFQATIAVRIPGYGVLSHDLRLLHRVRGGVGDELLHSASADAIAGRPCPWNPPCALDILFREQARIGNGGVPKPYVLAAHRKGQDLVVVMTLFGFAADWAGIAAHALVATLQHRIDWTDVRPALFLPRLSLSHVAITSSETLRTPPPKAIAELSFATPMNAEGDDPLDRPSTVLKRLARRIEGLARWQDATIEWDWTQLEAKWESANYDTTFLDRDEAWRRSSRARKSFAIDTVRGTLTIDALAPELWPLLVIGQETHVGKGATEGYGQYRLG